jgi:hypothetical protein
MKPLPYWLQDAVEPEACQEWLAWVAGLPLEEGILAQHICAEALAEWGHRLSRLVYEAFDPGWMLQHISDADTDDPRELFPWQWEHERIRFCPWCGERLPRLSEDDPACATRTCATSPPRRRRGSDERPV